MKSIAIVLGIACVALAATLAYHHNHARTRLNTALGELTTATNLVADTSSKLAEEKKLNGFLQEKLNATSTDLSTTSNDLARATTQLASIQTELTTVKTDVKTAQADAEAKGARITQLEAEKDEMSKKLGELAGQINTLDGQITETKRKLAAAEGDRSYLTKELARLQNDKADLLRQFNDLAVMRAQVALLRDEAAINQRIAWAAQGVYTSANRKGAEALLNKPTPAIKTDPGLDVELEKNGGVRVLPKSTTPQNP